MRNPDSTGWFGERSANGFYAELLRLPLRWWERLWYRLRPWPGSCRTYWGSHGCDRRRGHRGRHRCEGLIFNRCCHGYEAPPWWAPWRPDGTRYFGEDVPGDPEFVDGGELRYPS